MRQLVVLGIGHTSVRNHAGRSLLSLALEAVAAALREAGVEAFECLYVGNMLSAKMSNQGHLGPLLVSHCGFRGIEAVVLDAACASGAAALRQACKDVSGGVHDVVVALGVEKMCDYDHGELNAALVSAADAASEIPQGLTFAGINALLMRRYLHEFGLSREDFAAFSLNAHANAQHNPGAMYRRAFTVADYMASPMVADPIAILDSSPIADGAAAVVIGSSSSSRTGVIRVKASAAATDTLGIQDRENPLRLRALEIACARAYAQAGVRPDDIDLLEVHDAFTIMAALSLEASGFASQGRGTWLARDGEITPNGRIPISTMGGLKARGHPVGASGLFQVVEAVKQLRGEAGVTQVRGARLAMTQGIGGSGATAIAHILEAT